MYEILAKSNNSLRSHNDLVMVSQKSLLFNNNDNKDWISRAAPRHVLPPSCFLRGPITHPYTTFQQNPAICGWVIL